MTRCYKILRENKEERPFDTGHDNDTKSKTTRSKKKKKINRWDYIAVVQPEQDPGVPSG